MEQKQAGKEKNHTKKTQPAVSHKLHRLVVVHPVTGNSFPLRWMPAANSKVDRCAEISASEKYTGRKP